jgi:diaminobutyrate-2-oxoglutarate transaminase
MSVTSVNPAANATNEYYLTRQSQMESNVRSYPRKLPLAIAKAQGCWVTDVEGTEYLDCLAGAGTLALGHNHPAVIQSIQDTLASGLPLHTLDLTTPLKDAFTEAFWLICQAVRRILLTVLWSIWCRCYRSSD